MSNPSGPWHNPCPVCGATQPPCGPECGFRPDDEDLDLSVARQRAAIRKWNAAAIERGKELVDAHERKAQAVREGIRNGKP